MTRHWWVVLAVVVLGIGGWTYSASRPQSNQSVSPSPSGGSLNSADGDQKQPLDPDSSGGSSIFVPTGQKIAVNYYQSTAAAYQAAKEAKRPIFLYFFANWCPTCAEQEPRVVALMNGLSAQLSQVVAFRVNFNDSETDSQEKKLADELGVRYQHTMFVLNGQNQTVKKFLGKTSDSDLLAAFKKALLTG